MRQCCTGDSARRQQRFYVCAFRAFLRHPHVIGEQLGPRSQPLVIQTRPPLQRTTYVGQPGVTQRTEESCVNRYKTPQAPGGAERVVGPCAPTQFQLSELLRIPHRPPPLASTQSHRLHSTPSSTPLHSLHRSFYFYTFEMRVERVIQTAAVGTGTLSSIPSDPTTKSPGKFRLLQVQARKHRPGDDAALSSHPFKLLGGVSFNAL